MSPGHKFYTHLPEGGKTPKAAKDSEVKATETVLLKYETITAKIIPFTFTKNLRVSDADGTLKCTEVARGKLSRDQLDTNDG